MALIFSGGSSRGAKIRTFGLSDMATPWAFLCPLIGNNRWNESELGWDLFRQFKRLQRLFPSRGFGGQERREDGLVLERRPRP